MKMRLRDFLRKVLSLFLPMASEDVLTNSRFRITNLTGLESNVLGDDPDSDNGLWMDWDGNGNVDTIWDFATPTEALTAGANLQEYRALIRKDSTGGNDPTWELGVWEVEGGTYSLIETIASGTVTTLTGEVVSGTFNASIFTTASGANAVVQLLQTAGGTGSPGSRRGIDIGAFKWVAEVTPAVSTASGTSTSTGTLTALGTRLDRPEQEGYRWRNDNGSQTTATWRQIQDTPDSIAQTENIRLRMLTDHDGNPDTAQITLQYKRIDEPPSEWRDV